jgi:hypothetical protein
MDVKMASFTLRPLYPPEKNLRTCQKGGRVVGPQKVLAKRKLSPLPRFEQNTDMRRLTTGIRSEKYVVVRTSYSVLTQT